MGEIIAFALGVVTASAVWFFVWRNNQEKFAVALNRTNDVVAKLEEKIDCIKG